MAAAGDAVGVLVEGEVGVGEHGRGAGVPAAAQHRRHPGHQLLDEERLDDVVVAARLQPAHAVVAAVARGEEDDRLVEAVLAQPLQHVEAVELGHHHVEHDQVGVPVVDGLEGLAAVVGGQGAVPLEPQGRRDEVVDVGVVVDHQHAGSVVAHGTILPGPPTRNLGGPWQVPGSAEPVLAVRLRPPAFLRGI